MNGKYDNYLNYTNAIQDPDAVRDLRFSQPGLDLGQHGSDLPVDEGADGPDAQA